MPSEERNALAELAERINPIDPHPLDDDYMKSSRIISELAKCSGCIHRVGTTLTYTIGERKAVISAVDKCRAIAEEGVVDER